MSLIEDNRVEKGEKPIAKKPMTSEQYALRYLTRLENGDFEKEWQKRRKLAMGTGEPLDLSPEGRKKHVEDFENAIDLLGELLPDEFGPSEKESDKSMNNTKDQSFTLENSDACVSYPADDITERAHDFLSRETSEEFDRPRTRINNHNKRNNR